MSLIAKPANRPANETERRLAAIESALASSPVARGIRDKRAVQEALAAQMAAADGLARDAAKRRATAKAEWVPAARRYREHVAEAVALAAELERIAYLDSMAYSDLDRANDARGVREWKPGSLESFGDMPISPESLTAIDVVIARATKEHDQ